MNYFPLFFLLLLQLSEVTWRQTSWEGGSGQWLWEDTTRYFEAVHVDGVVSPGDLLLSTDDSTWGKTAELPGKPGQYTWWIESLLETQDGSVYAGTGLGGIFRSTDGGRSWKRAGNSLVMAIVFDLLEASDGTIFATAESNHQGKIFRSIDGGNFWEETGSLGDDVDYVFSIIQASSGSLFAGTDEGIFKSTDCGTTWVNVAEGGRRSLIEGVDETIYAAASSGPSDNLVIKSIDDGATWEACAKLDTAEGVTGLFCASDSTIYAAPWCWVDDLYQTAWLVKSRDKGQTWIDVCPNLPFMGYKFLETPDGIMYGAGWGDGVYKSVDDGANWVYVGKFSTMEVNDFIRTSSGIMYAGTSPEGEVWRTVYSPAGHLHSSVFDAGSADWGVMNWDADLNEQTIIVRVRTGSKPDMSDATPWRNCHRVENGEDISSLSSVNDGDRYIQYRVELSTADSLITPILHQISVNYTSSGIAEGDQIIKEARLLGNFPNPFTGTTEIKFQLAHPSRVSLKIYDTAGRAMRTLLETGSTYMDPGTYSIYWDGRDMSGKALPSGAYFISLKTVTYTAIEKVLLLE